MYIHSYQIHNVLNVYRKQLSQGGGASGGGNTGRKLTSQKDQITISMEGRRQSLFDRISSQIVERITQSSPETSLDKLVGLAKAGSGEQSAFTYSTIDENNQKRTHILSIRPFDAVDDGAALNPTAEGDDETILSSDEGTG